MGANPPLLKNLDAVQFKSVYYTVFFSGSFEGPLLKKEEDDEENAFGHGVHHGDRFAGDPLCPGKNGKKRGNYS